MRWLFWPTFILIGQKLWIFHLESISGTVRFFLTQSLKWWGPNRHIYLTINQMDNTDCESCYSTISVKMQQILILFYVYQSCFFIGFPSYSPFFYWNKLFSTVEFIIFRCLQDLNHSERALSCFGHQNISCTLRSDF